jgi:hypothetical protein
MPFARLTVIIPLDGEGPFAGAGERDTPHPLFSVALRHLGRKVSVI